MTHAIPTVEPARPHDLGGVVRLLRRVGLPPDGIEEHSDTLLVARTEGTVVGCAALETYPDGALLRSVAVDPSLRGRGLGVALTRKALDLAGSWGIGRVYLLTETAADFFPRFGFREIERTEVAEGVRRSIEFTSVCPASAVAMVLNLDGRGV